MPYMTYQLWQAERAKSISELRLLDRQAGRMMQGLSSLLSRRPAPGLHAGVIPATINAGRAEHDRLGPVRPVRCRARHLRAVTAQPDVRDN